MYEDIYCYNYRNARISPDTKYMHPIRNIRQSANLKMQQSYYYYASRIVLDTHPNAYINCSNALFEANDSQNTPNDPIRAIRVA